MSAAKRQAHSCARSASQRDRICSRGQLCMRIVHDLLDSCVCGCCRQGRLIVKDLSLIRARHPLPLFVFPLGGGPRSTSVLHAQDCFHSVCMPIAFSCRGVPRSTPHRFKYILLYYNGVRLKLYSASVTPPIDVRNLQGGGGARTGMNFHPPAV